MGLLLNTLPVILCLLLTAYSVFLLINTREPKSILSLLLPLSITLMFGIGLGHFMYNHTLSLIAMKYMSLMESAIIVILTIVDSRVFIKIHKEGAKKSDEFGIFLKCIAECDTEDIRKVRELFFQKNPKLNTMSKKIQNITRITEVVMILGFIFVVILTITV